MNRMQFLQGSICELITQCNVTTSLIYIAAVFYLISLLDYLYLRFKHVVAQEQQPFHLVMIFFPFTFFAQVLR